MDELAKESVRRAEPKRPTPPAPAAQPRREAAADEHPLAALDAELPPEPMPAVAEAKPPAADLAPLEFESSHHDHGGLSQIEVVESGDQIDAVVEQAAMLYASNQVAETIALLQDVLRIDGNARIEVWLMLFDLYPLRNMRTQFDELAVRFVEKFKRSSPDWPQGNKAAAPVVAKPASGSGYFALTGSLTADQMAEQLEQWEKLDGKGQAVRVEFSKVSNIDAPAAAILLAWLVKKTKSARQWQGLQQLSALVAGHYEVMRRDERETPFWLLQLELLQMLGRQEDFENMAVDYAVTFEVSPPSWDARKIIKGEGVVDVVAAAPLAATDVDVCVLSGEIVEGRDDELGSVKNYAADRRHLQLDMHLVPRMDFSSAGWLLNMLIAFQQEGKQVTILGANELMIGLFRVLGITDLATVVRKK